MTDASGVTNYGYDNRNRLASKQTPFGTLGYTYNAAGTIETLRSSSANGVSVDYDYDELNRLDSVTDNRLPAGSSPTTYAYDPVGNLESYTYPNQVTTTYGYNNLNRLTGMSVANTSGGLATYAYTLGAAGNRTQVVEASGRTVNYVYDDLYRLTRETIANASSNGQIDYGYDPVGNRLSRTSTVAGVANQTPTYDNNDRLESDGYDPNGNTRTSNSKTYNYDFENRLTSTSDDVSIVYDGDGNRVSKTVGGVTTFYLVDTNNLTGYAQVVEELQSGVGVVKQYTYGHDLISQRQGSTVSFYAYDGHGSARQLTNASGSVTDTYAYDAFGTLIERTGTTDNNYLYAGEQWDPDLGFYYNRARYLNVGTGRFISQDSYEGGHDDPATLHKYLYTGNNPIDRTDPSGNLFDSGSFSAASAMNQVLQSIPVPMLTRVLAGVATSLLIAGAVVSPFAELNSGLAQARVGLKERIERERKRGGNFELLFHYTSRENAVEIAGTGVIKASDVFRSRRLGITFPPGAYATDITPWNPSYTQSQLSALFYGGNEARDVSNFVAIKRNDFIQIFGVGNQFYRPSPPRAPVPVDVITFGPNLMLK